MRKQIVILLLGSALSAPAFAQDAPAPARKPLEARAEVNVRGGTDRSILMNEFWVPLTQTDNSVLYGDLRLMGDDQDNREFNAGVGYRRIVRDVPVLGDGVAGVHGWVDRRITERGSRFNQITAGAEWSGDVIDLKLNGYLPLSDEKNYTTASAASAPYLAGSGIYYDVTSMQITEEPQPGLDVELGFNVNNIIGDFTDSTRVYAGAYHFAGDKSENVSGWRARVASDITEDFQLGARFQRDDERGSQGFLEATIRFPFGNKKSYRDHGLYARLDESPERDIDIVTATTAPQPTGTAQPTPVINTASGSAQRVLYVDNTAAPGGTGSKDSPFNSLAAAQAAMLDNDVIYIATGDGTSTNMDGGFTIARAGVSLIGEGSAFVYDGGKFTTAVGANFSGTLLKAAGAAPVITNINVNGDGILITGRNTSVSGLTVTGASRHGVHALADNADLGDVVITNLTASNNTAVGVKVKAENNGVFNEARLSGLTTAQSGAGFSGVDVTADGGGLIRTASIANLTSNDNSLYGIVFQAGTNANGVGDIPTILIDGLSADSNQYAGLYIRLLGATSKLDNAILRNITSTNNTLASLGRGIVLRSQTSGQMGNVLLENITATGNADVGLLVETLSGASIASVTVDKATLSGNTGTNGYGLYALPSAGTSIGNLSVNDMTATGNSKHGAYLRAVGTGSLTASIQNSTMTGNAQHGIAVYDDTSGTFEIDLGGGGRSVGQNILAANTLEDLALDYDGRTIAAMNNWWGQATGPDQDAPNIGVRPQIYYGAPINDGLVGHWTFDTEWMNGTTVYDRSGNGYNGTLVGMTLAGNQVSGPRRQALMFGGTNNTVSITNRPAFQLTEGTWTASINTSNAGAGWRGIVQKSNGPGMYLNNNNFAAYDASTGLARLSGVNLGDGNNHFTAQTFRSGVANGSTFYIDGAANGNFSTTSTSLTGAVIIGAGQGGAVTQGYSGIIDDVRIYNRTLTAAEIAELSRMSTDSVVNFSGFLSGAP